jgi:hypothetical protein
MVFNEEVGDISAAPPPDLTASGEEARTGFARKPFALSDGFGVGSPGVAVSGTPVIPRERSVLLP